MKKFFAMTMCCVMVMGSLVGCGKRECDGCGKEAKCKKVTYAGESAYLCKDCEQLFNLGMDYLDSYY